MNTIETTDKVAADLMSEAIKSHNPVCIFHGDNTVAAPDNYKTFDLRCLQSAPPRRAESVTLTTLEDFVAYTGSRYDKQTSCIFVSDRMIKAVFDYSAPGGGAAWQTDAATFPMIHSLEWALWKNNNRSNMNQRCFLEFLEDNLATVIEPTGTEFYALVEQFRAMKSVEYMSGYRTSSGETKLVYNETTKGSQREITLPQNITIQVPIIQGAKDATTYQLKARIKFEIDNDTHKLLLRYELVRPDIPEHNAVNDLADFLRGHDFTTYCGLLAKNNYTQFCEFADDSNKAHSNRY